MNWLYEPTWSPFAVGIGIGLLTWISFIFSNRAIGCSTAYTRMSGIIEKLVRGKKVEQKKYYQIYKPKIDWEVILIMGIILGAFLSSVLSETFELEIIPELWKTAFGPSIIVRFSGAVCGGFLIGFGARMAGGCTSGHGISGTLQLAVGSWLAFVCFFGGGFITAIFLYTLLGGI